MNTLRLTALAAILLSHPILSPAQAASRPGRFDGSWSVVAVGSDSSCVGPYRYPIVIRDGQVDDAGGNDVDASGRAEADGGITGTIRRGLAVVSVTGRLKGKTGSGRWSLSGLGSCTGRWKAQKIG